MMNDVNLVRSPETTDTKKPQIGKASPKKETPVIPLPVQKKLPAPAPKEFPIDSWIMPPEQQGYIKGHDHDCL
jgi:hypothetical protein